VPFILVSRRFKELKRDRGSLIDVAPTILKMMGIEQPEEMTGESLI
jgi:2,3-bisphosphoglycerate-independent phosphoglycerate mutase